MQSAKDEEEQQSAKVATLVEVAAGGGWVAGTIFRWFEDKGYGFAKVAGEDDFVHASVLLGTVECIINAKVVIQVMMDGSRGG